MNGLRYLLKNKVRFNYKGMLSAEDLYDLKIEELNTIYQNLRRQEKEQCEDSLLTEKTSEDVKLKAMIDFVVSVVEEKRSDAEARLKAKETKAEKQKIMKLIAEKKDEALNGLSIEDLQKLLDNM